MKGRSVMDKKVISLEQKQMVLDTFNANASGCFIQVTGYENANGEVSTYQLQSGVNYGNVINMSVEQLKDIKAGNEVKELEVKCNVWEKSVDEISKLPKDHTIEDECTNRKATGRTYKPFAKPYKWDSAEFQTACDVVMESLINPKKVEQSYEKEAKGLYSIDEETLYIRQCLVVNKVVEKDGVYPQSATLPLNALKEKIKGLLKVSKYRTFKLEQFDSISINGTLIQ
jgi:hypothetical protein